jgi:dTMP kinase
MDNQGKGRFLVLEGIDGSGKSTQLALLRSKLRAKGIAVHSTREPTDSPIGLLIHQHMTHQIHLQEATVAALFVADRLDHVLNDVDGMAKHVKSGTTVLSDRYYFSSYAYHSLHVPMEWVIEANTMSARLLRPDLNIFVDVTPETCLGRLVNSRGNLERYEKQRTLETVREMYFKAFEKLKEEERVIVVDGHREPEEISDEIWAHASQLFCDHDS